MNLMPHYHGLLWALLPLTCTPQTVYRWVDTDGQLQLSDRPPGIAAERLELPATSGPATGLRRGERARLEDIDRQLAAQRRAADARQRAARAQRRRSLAECRRWRDTLRHERDAGQRKSLARNLRAHCW